ncbi:MAG TPA: hypothetical protein VL400_02420, partial [Polyangiaceae bacterium]|nr:hypothetical protein [Polyangiaceae bacterium]
MTISNVDTGESVSAQFNPEEVSEKLTVNYKDLEIMGFSHKPQQYQNTSNLALSFTLGFDALSVDGGSVQRTRLFLHSLCYSRRGASEDVVGGGPPKVV